MWYKLEVGSLAGSNGHYRELHNGIVSLSAPRGPAGAVLPAERRFQVIVPSRLVRELRWHRGRDGPSPDLTQWPPQAFTAALALVCEGSVCSA